MRAIMSAKCCCAVVIIQPSTRHFATNAIIGIENSRCCHLGYAIKAQYLRAVILITGIYAGRESLG